MKDQFYIYKKDNIEGTKLSLAYTISALSKKDAMHKFKQESFFKAGRYIVFTADQYSKLK